MKVELVRNELDVSYIVHGMDRFDGATQDVKCNNMWFPHMKRRNGFPIYHVKVIGRSKMHAR